MSPLEVGHGSKHIECIGFFSLTQIKVQVSLANCVTTGKIVYLPSFSVCIYLHNIGKIETKHGKQLAHDWNPERAL